MPAAYDLCRVYAADGGIRLVPRLCRRWRHTTPSGLLSCFATPIRPPFRDLCLRHTVAPPPMPAAYGVVMRKAHLSISSLFVDTQNRQKALNKAMSDFPDSPIRYRFALFTYTSSLCHYVYSLRNAQGHSRRKIQRQRPYRRTHAHRRRSIGHRQIDLAQPSHGCATYMPLFALHDDASTARHRTKRRRIRFRFDSRIRRKNQK